MTNVLPQSFNPMEHNPAQGIGQLDIGRHPLVVESAEVKKIKDVDGGLVEFILRAIDGPCAGRKQAYRLNLYHPDERTREIAQRQLSALCWVTRVPQLGADGRQLSALFEQPFAADIRQQKNNDQYTEVGKVYTIEGHEPVAGEAPPVAGQAQQSNGSSWGGNATMAAPAPAQAPAPAPAPASNGWGGGSKPKGDAPNWAGAK